MKITTATPSPAPDTAAAHPRRQPRLWTQALGALVAVVVFAAIIHLELATYAAGKQQHHSAAVEALARFSPTQATVESLNSATYPASATVTDRTVTVIDNAGRTTIDIGADPACLPPTPVVPGKAVSIYTDPTWPGPSPTALVQSTKCLGLDDITLPSEQAAADKEDMLTAATRELNTGPTGWITHASAAILPGALLGLVAWFLLEALADLMNHHRSHQHNQKTEKPRSAR